MITHVSKEEFKKWIGSSKRKTKPFAEYKSVKPIEDNSMVGRSLSEQEVTDLIAKMEANAGAAVVGAAVVPLAVAEVDVVRHDLGAAAVVAVPVLPVADLEAALRHGHAALAKVLADELRRLPPGHHVDEVRALLAGVLVLEVPVHREGEAGHGDTGLGGAQLRVLGQAAHDDDMVQHTLTSAYSPLRTIIERRTPSVIPRIRSSSLGKAGSLVKLMST